MKKSLWATFSSVHLAVLLFWSLVPTLAFGGGAEPNLLGGPHIMPKQDGPPINPPNLDGLVTKLSAPKGAHLNYYGGSVVSNMHVVQVLWGTGGVGSSNGQFLAGVKDTSSPSMATFYQAVLNSSYVGWLIEYNTDIIASGGGPGTNQTIGAGDFVGQYAITPSNNSNLIDDFTIQLELANQIFAGHLPAPTTDGQGNNNTYYAIFFPHGMTITEGGSSSCVGGGFCAYHGTTFDVNNREIYYGVHPDMQAGSGCDLGCGTNSTTFDNQTSVASHEMVETLTDPEVGLAGFIAPPLAWYDPKHGEIGDICNGKDSSVVGNDGLTYAVQTEFSNAAHNCIVTGVILKITPTKVNFGKVTATASGKPHTFTVTNKGFVPAVLGTISASASSFQVSPGTCSGSIAPKANCKLSVTFAPTLADNAESGTLMVPYNGGTATADLSGTAATATLSVPTSVTLTGAAPTGIGLSKTMTITNHSNASITLGATPTPADFTLAPPDQCTGMTLLHGQSCTITVEATPGSGKKSGDILSEPLNYPFSYGSNNGTVMTALKSKVL